MKSNTNAIIAKIAILLLIFISVLIVFIFHGNSYKNIIIALLLSGIAVSLLLYNHWMR